MYIKKRFLGWLFTLVVAAQLIGGLVPPAAASNVYPWEFTGSDWSGEPFVVTGHIDTRDYNPQPVRVTGFEYAGLPNEEGLVYEAPEMSRITTYMPFLAVYDGYEITGKYTHQGEVVVERILLAQVTEPIELMFTWEDVAMDGGLLSVSGTSFPSGSVVIQSVRYTGSRFGVLFNNQIDLPEITAPFVVDHGEFIVSGDVTLDGSTVYVTSVMRVPNFYPCETTIVLPAIPNGEIEISYTQDGPGIDGLKITDVAFVGCSCGVVYQDTMLRVVAGAEPFHVKTKEYELFGSVLPVDGGADALFITKVVRFKTTPQPDPEPQPEPAPTPKPVPVPQPVRIILYLNFMYIDTAGILTRNGVRIRNCIVQGNEYFPEQCVAVPARDIHVAEGDEYFVENIQWAHGTIEVEVSEIDGVVIMKAKNGDEILAFSHHADTTAGSTGKKLEGDVFYNNLCSILYKGNRVKLIEDKSGRVFTVYADSVLVEREWPTGTDMGYKAHVSLVADTKSCNGYCLAALTGGRYSVYR